MLKAHDSKDQLAKSIIGRVNNSAKRADATRQTLPGAKLEEHEEG
jgi:hypothetical protein